MVVSKSPTFFSLYLPHKLYPVQPRTIAYSRATFAGFCTPTQERAYSHGEKYTQCRQMQRTVHDQRKLLWWPLTLQHVRSASTEIRESVHSPSSESIQSSAMRAVGPIVEWYRHYGFTALTVHTVGAMVSMMFWWGLTASPVDLMKFFGEVGILTPLTLLITRVAELVPFGSFVIAYCLHKITAPLRWIVTIALTPYLVRRNAGKPLVKQLF